MTEIRELQEKDNFLFRELWVNALTRDEIYFRTSIDDDLNPSIPTEFTQDSFTLGAFNGNELVGILSLKRETKTKLNHKALVFGMYVAPIAASKGLGKLLMQELITRVKENDFIQQLYLTVLVSNDRAKNLYTSMGFEEFAVEPRSVKIQGDYVDEYQMVLFI